MLKNILIVNDFAHVNGGAGQVALFSAVNLARHGYRVIVFSAVEPVMPDLKESGVDVVVTRQQEILKGDNRLRASIQGVWNCRAQRKMEEVLRPLSPENTIVHVHSWTKALSSSVVKVAIKYRFKVVCTMHDYFSVCPNGGFFDFSRNEICSEDPLSFGCISRNCDSRSYSHKLWRVVRHGVQARFGMIPSGVRHFIAVSDFSAAILKPFLPVGAEIHRVGNPVNIERGQCIDASLNEDFLFVGRLSSEKGAGLFAQAAHELGISPVFVGEGPLRQEIERVCPDARITGWVSGKEVAAHLSRARALVLPSLCYETQGMVVAEAAAVGVPAIVPDTCAARDMVDNHQTGLWFRGGAVDDLILKIRQIRKQPNLSASLGKAAYERYWQSPSTMEAHIAQLENCYNRIIS